MNHFSRFPLPVHEEYSGPIDCEQTYSDWVRVMEEARVIRFKLTQLAEQARNLEGMCSDNRITCEPNMADQIEAAISDMNLDGLISRIDGETAKYLEG